MNTLLLIFIFAAAVFAVSTLLVVLEILGARYDARHRHD